MNIIIYSVIIFLFTLDSFYDYSLNIAYLPYFGAIILFIFKRNIFIKAKFSFKELFIPLLILSAIIISLFISVSDLSKIIYINRLYALICGCLVFAIFARISNEKSIYLAVRNVIYIHLTFFFIQFFSHYIFSYDLDFLEWFSGERQRNIVGSISLPILGSNFRASGLFVEPSTYCSYITSLYCFFSYLETKERNGFIVNSIFISNILTFSFTGFILSFIFYISSLFKFYNKTSIFYIINNLKIKTYSIFIYLLGALVAIQCGNYIVERLILYPEVFIMRSESIAMSPNLIIGNGILHNDRMLPSVGLFIYFFSQVGIIIVFPLLIYLFKINRSRKLIPILLLGLSKVTLYSPFVFFALSSYFNTCKKRIK